MEKEGERLSDLGAPIWVAYIHEFHKSKGDRKEVEQNESWSCANCSFVNAPQNQLCQSCGTPRKESDWANFGRKARKEAAEKGKEKKKKFSSIE